MIFKQKKAPEYVIICNSSLCVNNGINELINW
jgi:hypothetical protein